MSRRQVLLQSVLLAGLIVVPAMARQTGPGLDSASQDPEVQRFVQRFRAANTTGDGHLTLAQAQAGHLPMIARNFDAIDVRHKGYVTLQDIRAWRQQRRGAGQSQGD